MRPSSASSTASNASTVYEIGMPYEFKHDLHIRYNFTEARFEGVPDNFVEYLAANAAAVTKKLRASATISSSTRTSGSSSSSSFGRPSSKRGRSPPRLSDEETTSPQDENKDPMLLLNQHFQLHFRHVPRLVVHGYEDRIPAVLVMLQQHFMAKQGYLHPHIFRESPNKSERDQAMRDINHGTFCGAMHDVRVLADLIKVWFRELPVPILHEIAPDQMEAVAKASNVMIELHRLLGPVERGVILWLADLLVYVAQYQAQNHMGLDQLAIVIAPNLVRIETANPMVAVTVSKAVVDLFRGVLYARREAPMSMSQV